MFLGTDPSAAPAMYHLMSALDLDEGVQYPQGGFREVVERIEALAREAGAQIVTGAEVNVITTRREEGAGGSTWEGLGGDLAGRRPGRPRTELPAGHRRVRRRPAPHRDPAARRARPQLPESWWRRRTSGPGAVIVMLGVRGGLPQLPHHSLFFTRDWATNFADIFGADPRVPSPASIYVCKPSASDTAVAPAGHENLFVLIPVPADTALGAGGPDGTGASAVEAAADEAIDQIARWAGIPDLRERIVVRQTLGPADFARDYHSWRGGMLGPAHILGQSAMFRAQNASKRVDGLYYAGATTAPGVGVPMCLISAELVLKRIRGDRTAGPVAPPVRVEALMWVRSRTCSAARVDRRLAAAGLTIPAVLLARRARGGRGFGGQRGGATPHGRLRHRARDLLPGRWRVRDGHPARAGAADGGAAVLVAPRAVHDGLFFGRVSRLDGTRRREGVMSYAGSVA